MRLSETSRSIFEGSSDTYAADEGDKQKSHDSVAKKRGRPKNIIISDDSSAIAKAAIDEITSEVMIKGLPEGPDLNPATATEIIITDENGERHVESLCCLFCDKAIED